MKGASCIRPGIAASSYNHEVDNELHHDDVDACQLRMTSRPAVLPYPMLTAFGRASLLQALEKIQTQGINNADQVMN